MRPCPRNPPQPPRCRHGLPPSSPPPRWRSPASPSTSRRGASERACCCSTRTSASCGRWRPGRRRTTSSSWGSTTPRPSRRTLTRSGRRCGSFPRCWCASPAASRAPSPCTPPFRESPSRRRPRGWTTRSPPPCRSPRRPRRWRSGSRSIPVAQVVPIHAAILRGVDSRAFAFTLLPRDEDGVVRQVVLALPTQQGQWPTSAGWLCEVLDGRCETGLIDYALGPAYRYMPARRLLEIRDDKALERLFGGRIVFVAPVAGPDDRVAQSVSLAGWEAADARSPRRCSRTRRRFARSCTARRSARRRCRAMLLAIAAAALVALVAAPVAPAVGALAAVAAFAGGLVALRLGWYAPFGRGPRHPAGRRDREPPPGPPPETRPGQPLRRNLSDIRQPACGHFGVRRPNRGRRVISRCGVSSSSRHLPGDVRPRSRACFEPSPVPPRRASFFVRKSAPCAESSAPSPTQRRPPSHGGAEAPRVPRL